MAKSKAIEAAQKAKRQRATQTRIRREHEDGKLYRDRCVICNRRRPFATVDRS